LLSYINTKLKVILGRIINKSKTKIIFEKLNEFEDYVKLLPRISKLLTSSISSIIIYDDIKKSILALSYILFEFLEGYLDLSNDNMIKKQSCEIISYILENLTNYLIVNDLDSSVIKTSMEILREKGKQRIMNAYSKDEEQRQIENELRKMGDKGILNINDDYNEEVRVEENPVINLDPINEYEGDNIDGDNDNDEYYVPADN
jgi:hypothetical protein